MMMHLTKTYYLVYLIILGCIVRQMNFNFLYLLSIFIIVLFWIFYFNGYTWIIFPASVYLMDKNCGAWLNVKARRVNKIIERKKKIDDKMVINNVARNILFV